MPVPVSGLPKAGNLPADVTSFIGRRQMVTEARRMISATRLLTFTGPGGIGKTRLALRVAAEVRRTFADGAWFVELAGVLDEKLVGQAVATTLGLRDQSDEPALDVLLDHIGDRRILLVLDNCEQVIDGVAILARKLLSEVAELRIVATSRQPLGVEGERVVQVPPLSMPCPDTSDGGEAVRLFADRAEAVCSGFTVNRDNEEHVALLCRRLAGIPLAIELAAVRTRTMSIDEIVSRLDDRLTLLGGGRRAMPQRQRTLRAALDWSFDLCSPQEQAMWARVSVFAGGFDLRDAEQVCSGHGIEWRDVFELVAGLVDKSILLLDGDRYRLLDPIHEYGAELLARSGDEERMRRRHRDWYRQVATQAEAAWLGPDQVRWLDRLQHEKDNLRAALGFCLTQPGQTWAALELISALWNYWVFTFGSFAEGRRQLDRALALDTQPSPRRAKALWVNAWFALRQGDVEVATALLEECETLARSLDDTSALACATHFQGLISFFQGRTQDAITLLEDANDRYDAEGSVEGSWMAMFHLVMATSTADDHERADIYGARCLALCEERSAYLSRSNALWAVGYGRWQRGDQHDAAALLEDGLRAMGRAGDVWGIAECLEVLAWIAAADGRHEQGARLLGAAQAAWRSLGASVPGMRPLAASHDRCEALLRERLGDTSFAGALRAGAEGGLDKAVAGALGERAKPGKARSGRRVAHPLTRREREIAELVAQGLRNKDIAATLVIAPRTAENHVENILHKLGFTSRTQIASWVMERKGTTD